MLLPCRLLLLPVLVAHLPLTLLPALVSTPGLLLLPLLLVCLLRVLHSLPFSRHYLGTIGGPRTALTTLLMGKNE